YAMGDDHEVENDWDGETVDPMLMAAGLQAFQEYMPLREPSGWPHRLFRIFRWGKEVELIILDERQYRSADAEPSCLLVSGIPDPAPTLPPLIRLLVGLPPLPPPGCLEALYDPTRTMLGALQKAFLKAALLFSSATFKFIINEVPITELFGLPYDRWEGYRAERDELLEVIRDHQIKNVVFLTTDLHANLVADVRLDTFQDRTPVAKEVIVGPIAQATLQQELEGVLGSDADTVVALLTLLIRPDCIELDAFAYGLVEVDATKNTATITLKDDGGEPFCRVTLFGRG
ncbi:MAG: alkaline phosphatase D family protein, partial [Candidatus Methylomirabilales bacterium]